MSTLLTTNLKNPSSGSNNIVLGTDGSATVDTAKITTLADSAGANTSTPAEIASGRAKAWVNFDGTGTVAILASYNVSSITDNGTGDYTLNYTSSLADTNYSIIGLAYGGPAYRAYPIVSTAGGIDLTRTVSSTRFRTYRSGSGTNIEDCVSVNVQVFR